MKSNKKICKFCNKEYLNLYTNMQYGTKYTLNTIFCSKSCAAKARRSSEELTKEVVEKEILEFILSKNRYCTNSEIINTIKRSNKTLTKLKISMCNLNNMLGFFKSNSNFENNIYNALSANYNNIICEYTNEKLLSPKGYPLRIDFYIPSKNLMIEADGLQHYDENHIWYSEYSKECDEIKNQYCLDNNIKLVRIIYKKLITEKYVLDCIINS
jgi:hypothetical protein